MAKSISIDGGLCSVWFICLGAHARGPAQEPRPWAPGRSPEPQLGQREPFSGLTFITNGPQTRLAKPAGDLGPKAPGQPFITKHGRFFPAGGCWSRASADVQDCDEFFGGKTGMRCEMPFCHDVCSLSSKLWRHGSSVAGLLCSRTKAHVDTKDLEASGCSVVCTSI